MCLDGGEDICREGQVDRGEEVAQRLVVGVEGQQAISLEGDQPTSLARHPQTVEQEAAVNLLHRLRLQFRQAPPLKALELQTQGLVLLEHH